jgi:hypothetical protein
MDTESLIQEMTRRIVTGFSPQTGCTGHAC